MMLEYQSQQVPIKSNNTALGAFVKKSRCGDIVEVFSYLL
jgi:hypothetical protein